MAAKEKKFDPFPGLPGGYLVSPKMILGLERRQKVGGALQLLLIQLLLAETVSHPKRPEWAEGLTAGAIKRVIGYSTTAIEQSLADLAARSMIARERDGRSWKYKVTPQNWDKAPKYVAKIVPVEAPPAEAEEPAAAAPAVRDGRQFVVKPGKFRKAVILSEAVGKLELSGEIPNGLRFEHSIASGTLHLGVFGGEDKANLSPSVVTLLHSADIDSKVVSQPRSTPKTAPSPDPLLELANRTVVAWVKSPMPDEQLRLARQNLNGASLPDFEARLHFRRKNYKSHGLFSQIAKDVGAAHRARAAGSGPGSAGSVEDEERAAHERYMAQQTAMLDAERRGAGKGEKT